MRRLGFALGWVPVTLALLFPALFKAVQAANPLSHPLSVGWQANQKWFTQSTAHFELHAPQELIEHLPRIAALAEQAHEDISQSLGWSPAQKTQLVLTDDTDVANGWATVYPFNQNRIFISAPDSVNSLEDYRDWLGLLIRHEYTHTLHLDQARGVPAALRAVFGRQAFSFPHLFQPLWMIEGLAIDQETNFERGEGRGQSDYYAMQMRAEVERGLASLGRVSGLNRDWPAGQAYLYGAYFYQFLREVYGDQAVDRWLKSYSYNLIPYWMNPTARRVWGEDFSNVWQRYQAWLQKHYPVIQTNDSQGEALTNQGGAAYQAVWRNQTFYRIEADGHSQPRLIKQAVNGMANTQTLTSIDYPAQFDISEDERVVMAQGRPNRQNRVYSDLWLWDAKHGWQRITHNQRYRQAVWLTSDELIARRQIAGVSELHLLSSTGQLIATLWQGDEHTVLGDFALHPSAKKLVAMKKPPGESWQLAEFDLEQRAWTWLTQNRFNQANPVYSADGKQVVYSANYDSTYQIYQMDTDTFELIALTNVATGAFAPIVTDKADLVFQRYSAHGYDWIRLTPEEQVLKHLALSKDNDQAWSIKPTLETEISLTEPRGYQPLKTLKPRAWWPVINLTPQRNQWGVMFDGHDALARHHYQVNLAYDDLAQQPFGSFSYQMDNRYLLQLSRSWREGYNASKPDELVLLRVQDSAVFGGLNVLNFQHDQAAIHLGLVHETERDVWRDPRLVSLPSTQRTDVSLVWHWDSRQTFRYGISPASGWLGYVALDAHLSDKGQIGSSYQGKRLQLDLKHYFHVYASQVLHTRFALGYADKHAHPFVLGSERGVFETALFARTDYPLRGYSMTGLVEQQFALASVEYRAPLARIQQNWQVYPLGIRDVYGQVFVDNGLLNQQVYTAVGGQITLEAVLGFRMLIPFTLGYAKGLDQTLGQTQWWLTTELAF